mmetsp:Transcript_9473/g.18286  ORF Transcript_9473/g.18286 Transcript_9473/m.18286 type:complete len:81 (+) Transcript_9473:3837-4079(+)
MKDASQSSNIKWTRVDLSKFNLSFCNSCPEVFAISEDLHEHIRRKHPLPKRHKPVEDDSVCYFCRLVPVDYIEIKPGMLD